MSASVGDALGHGSIGLVDDRQKDPVADLVGGGLARGAPSCPRSRPSAAVLVAVEARTGLAAQPTGRDELRLDRRRTEALRAAEAVPDARSQRRG